MCSTTLNLLLSSDKQTIVKKKFRHILIFFLLVTSMLFTNASRLLGAQSECEIIAGNFLAFLHCNKKIISTNILKNNMLDNSLPKIPIAYLFTLQNGGFILVSFSKSLTPIKAYSLNNDFETLPPKYKKYLLLELEYNIRALRNQKRLKKREITVNPENQRRWDFLLNYPKNSVRYTYEPDTFLLTTKWNQGYPYNKFLPKIDSNNVVAGCVNIAVAQVMNYHQHPLRGKGVISYTWNGQNLKAIFYKDYHWHFMPDRPDAITPEYEIDEMSRLIKDIGIANRTNFGLESSSTSVNRDALIQNFYYSTEMATRDNSDEDLFFTTIKNEIEANRPVILHFPGHLTVADGYSSNPTGREIHVNFGWGGHADGYYFLDQTVITSSHQFSIESLKITYNIKPCTGGDCYTNLEPEDGITPSDIQGKFNSSKDIDEYEVYLKGATNISGTRGYSSQAFFISLYDYNYKLMTSLDNSISTDVPAGKYKIDVSLCSDGSCYSYVEGKLNYSVFIETGVITNEEKLEIDIASDIPPVIINDFQDIALNMNDGSHNMLIEAVDENGDTLSLEAFCSNPNINISLDNDHVLTITPNSTISQAAGKITIKASANNKADEKSFVVLASDEKIYFGKYFEINGLFLNQDTFNKHKVILDGNCSLIGDRGYSNQAFFTSVMDLSQNYMVEPIDNGINETFSQNFYLIGASLWQHPEELTGTYYSYKEDVNNAYVIKVSCPEANDDIASIANLLGIEISALYDYYYKDQDNDGYGDPNNRIFSITHSPGYVMDNRDCNDTNSNINSARVEICDAIDNDCDGAVDDGFDLQTDPNNCGACGHSCQYVHAVDLCSNGTCIMGTCDNGYYNLNNDPSDGCEYACTVSNGGAEICDGFDNNCNGTIDEGFSKESDPQNCGSCGHVCPSYPHATAVCSNGQCTMGVCDAGWQDQDKDAGNGCEYCENCQESGDCLFRAAITAIGQDLSGANNASTVYLGIAENAVTYPTPGYQPNYTVDMRLTGDLLEDIRQTGTDHEVWTLMVEIGSYAKPDQAGYYPVLNWNSGEFCGSNLGYFKLYSIDNEGRSTLVVGDMYQAGSYQTKEEDGQCIFGKCYLSYSIVWSKDIEIDMNLSANWSMISLPVIPRDPRACVLFPDAQVIYGFEKGIGYVRVTGEEDLEAGAGYWILLSDAHSYTLTGMAIEEYTVLVEDGWLMTGACSSSAQASVENADIDVIYGFTPGLGYNRLLSSDNLEAGKG